MSRTDIKPQPKESLLRIAPYKGGESALPGVETVHKLSSNESPLGPSPEAVAAFQAAAKALHRYPDGAAKDLRTALARHYGLDETRILCGNGSDELLTLLVHAYCGSGDEVLYSRHGFLIYPIAAMACGAEPVIAEEENYATSVDSLLSKVTPRTKIVFLANPNNPTGSYLSASEVKRLHAGLRPDILLVIDAAYAEYVSRDDYTPGVELVEAHDNVVMTRTFSKIFGLAGLRVGWTYAPTGVVDAINRIRGPFNLNSPAQAAAIAALEDKVWTAAARAHNDEWLPKLERAITALGLKVLPSVGNFLLIHFPKGVKNAEAADQFLRARGLILRQVKAYHLPDYLRLTVGRADENKKVIAALDDFTKA